MREHYIVEFDGLDYIPSGVVTTRYPWSQLSASVAATITEDAGAFPNAKGMQFHASTTSNTQSMTMAFPSSATFMRNNTAPEGKSIWGFGTWFRVDQISANFNPIPLVQLGTIYSTGVIPLFGIRNSPQEGIKLCFPTNLTNVATAPTMVDLQMNTFYWIYVKMAINPNGVCRASYYINNIPIVENITVTMSADPISSYPCNRIVFMSASSNIKYTIDDPNVQLTHGGEEDWVAGFPESDGVPNRAAPRNPTISMLPQITSRRVSDIPINGDGSSVDFTPSDPSLENWEAATSDGEYVQATERGQVDVYTVDPSQVALRDIIAVKFQARTNTYFSLTSAYKTGESEIESEVGVINRGGNNISYVLEVDGNGEIWDAETLEASQFGLKTL